MTPSAGPVRRPSRSVALWTGVAIVVLALTVLTGWSIRSPALVQLQPSFTAMVVNTALCFLCVGFSLVLGTTQLSKRLPVSQLLGGVAALLGTLCFLETVFGSNLGIDATSFHAWLVDGNPKPGRMAPNTALGFMLAGLVLLLRGRVESRATGIFVQVATFLVLVLGLTGLVGYTLQLELLYSWFRAPRMAVHTAVGMILVGLGLWSSWHRAAWYGSRQNFSDDEKIGFVGAALLMIVALTTGIAGFAAQESTLEKILSEQLPSELRERTDIIREEVIAGISRSQHAARTMDPAALVRPRDSDSDRLLRAWGRRVQTTGLSSVVLRDADGVEQLRMGRVASQPAFQSTPGPVAKASLLWNGALRLRTVVAVRQLDVVVGTLTFEQAMPRTAAVLMSGEILGKTGELSMCIARVPQLQCFPQHRNRSVYFATAISASRRPTPIGLAVAGKTGVFKGLDYRGRNVIAAYDTIPEVNVGVALKRETEELFAPIRQQLQWSIPLMLLLALLGAAVLRRQVTPLATRLLRSERDAIERELRISTVVASVGDGIITINERSTIETFNRAASEIFGYPPEEVIGRNLTLLMPHALQAAHTRGVQRFLGGGVPRVIGKKAVELPGLRRDGKIFPMELSVREMELRGRRLFVGIVRDITQRKESEEALYAETERLRVTLGSIADGVITTHRDGSVRYLNAVAEDMTGWTNEEAQGKPLLTVFNIVDERTDAPAPNPVDLALGSAIATAVEEETTLLHREGPRCAIEQSTAPILDRDGGVVGVVVVFRDVNHARQHARTMSHLASHDALTGLINRREFERRLSVALATGVPGTAVHTVLFMDLDEFKFVNDTGGHEAGDELLRQLAAVMQGALRRTDVLARLGGDEFGLLLEGCPAAHGLRVANVLRQAVEDFQLNWNGRVYRVGVSIGLATLANADRPVAEVMKMVDAACYVAKAEGRNRIHVGPSELLPATA